MMAYADRLRRRTIDPEWLITYWSDRVHRLLSACVRDRELVPAAHSVDISFHQLGGNEIAVLEGLSRLRRLRALDVSENRIAALPPADRAETVEEAVHHYFSVRAQMKQNEFRQLMRRGRLSLIIGLLFLAGCLFLAGFAAGFGAGTATDIVREGLTIVGWVAMWRPLEIYLYSWWPLREEQRLFVRLARMHVRLVLPVPEKP